MSSYALFIAYTCDDLCQILSMLVDVLPQAACVLFIAYTCDDLCQLLSTVMLVDV